MWVWQGAELLDFNKTTDLKLPGSALKDLCLDCEGQMKFLMLRAVGHLLQLGQDVKQKELKFLMWGAVGQLVKLGQDVKPKRHLY